MKLKILFTLLFASMSMLSQEFKTPVDYLSFIGNEQQNISKSMWKYTSAVAHSKSARKIDNTRKALVKIIQNASNKISDLKSGYNGDLEYRDQVISYLSISEKSINEEYSKIIDMQEVAEQSYDFMEAYILARDLVNKKIEEEDEKVALAQKTFALKYKITLTDANTELAKKMETSNEVFKYHTNIYLLFFKVNITDILLTKSIESKDLGAIQQNANTLIQYANEGLEKLTNTANYNNDNSLAEVTKKSLEYYKKEAEQYVPQIISFHMFNEKFENAKKTLEDKSQKDRTQEEVNNFNSMVKQINKKIEDYNKSNNNNNQEKNNIINNWNSVAENFISEHVPAE
jgi:hypothetical protein